MVCTAVLKHCWLDSENKFLLLPTIPLFQIFCKFDILLFDSMRLTKYAQGNRNKKHCWLNHTFELFLKSNSRRVLNVVCFLLGNSPASVFCMHTKFGRRDITQKKVYNTFELAALIGNRAQHPHSLSSTLWLKPLEIYFFKHMHTSYLDIYCV